MPKMPKMPNMPKISNLPKPPVPAWLSNHENKAKGYSYVNLVVQVYQLYSFWFDVYPFGKPFAYSLIFCVFVIFPVVLGFFLLISVHKRELQKVGLWWVLEIPIFTLQVTLFITGIHGITWKTILNLVIHGALRIYGLKVIYDYMVSLNAEICTSINKVNVSHSASDTRLEMEDVPLDNAWSGDVKL